MLHKNDAIQYMHSYVCFTPQKKSPTQTLPAEESCFASVRQAALQLFNQMLELEYVPDKITYTATISTCTDCIQWPQALALLHFAELSQLQLDVIPYNATITACEKASRWNQAMVLLSTIDNKPDLQADSISFTATGLKRK